MNIRCFTIPVHDPAPAEQEVNGFLGSHRVLSVEKRFVEEGMNSFWALAVEYLPTEPGAASASRRKERKDYMQLLPPQQFAVFARLRDVRRDLAKAEGVPPYVVLTDEQLAALVTQQVRSRADMKAIEGIGDGKIAKYGDAFLAELGAEVAEQSGEEQP